MRQTRTVAAPGQSKNGGWEHARRRLEHDLHARAAIVAQAAAGEAGPDTTSAP
jgi:hypothetical protein